MGGREGCARDRGQGGARGEGMVQGGEWNGKLFWNIPYSWGFSFGLLANATFLLLHRNEHVKA